MTRRAVVTLAAVALTAGVFVSGAKAAPPLCGSKQCAEEITAACGSLSGADFRACKKLVLDQCKSGTGNGQLTSPFGVATDGAGNVYIADTNNARIQKFDASGTFLTTWGSLGSGDGQFSGPEGVATDGSGNVYVADSRNNRIQKFACPTTP